SILSSHHLISLIHSFPYALSTLSLHAALPISVAIAQHRDRFAAGLCVVGGREHAATLRHDADHREPIGGDRHRAAAWPRVHDRRDRKSTRLNSSHVKISYAVFCLKKKTTKQK